METHDNERQRIGSSEAISGGGVSLERLVGFEKPTKPVSETVRRADKAITD